MSFDGTNTTVTMFTQQHQDILSTTERVASGISLICCFMVTFTFLWSSRFRKPINRLIMYATIGNVLMNIGTLISINGMLAGFDSSLCQFQGFLIQAFLPADAFWNLAMAINTYLTVFKRYTPKQCKSMEKYYCMVNYGLFGIIALAYLFVYTEDKDKMYGRATLWCWINPKYDSIRLVTCYVPAWCAILVSFSIYALSGRELFKRRRQFSRYRTSSETLPAAIENPFTSFKTTEVHITHELASPRPFDNSSTHSQIELQQVNLERQYLGGTKDYEQYSITIERNLGVPVRAQTTMNEDELKLRNTVMASNRAAWSYCKCCILFFTSLIITWFPSSTFRTYTLVHTQSTNFGIAYATGLVLPLMGFWNAVIYFTISFDAVRDMLAGDIDQRVWRQWHGQLPGMKRPKSQWVGNNGDENWTGRPRRLSLNSKEEVIEGRSLA